jgi:hypothetical protein
MVIFFVIEEHSSVLACGDTEGTTLVYGWRTKQQNKQRKKKEYVGGYMGHACAGFREYVAV